MHKLKAMLTKKIGPLPTFAWLLILVGALVAWKMLHKGKNSPDQSSANSTDNALSPTVDPNADGGAIAGTDGTNGADGVVPPDALGSPGDSVFPPDSGQFTSPGDPTNFGDFSNTSPPSNDPGPSDHPTPPPHEPDTRTTKKGAHPGRVFWNGTWMTKAELEARLAKTGVAPSVWAKNHPDAAKKLGISPTPKPAAKKPSKLSTLLKPKPKPGAKPPARQTKPPVHPSHAPAPSHATVHPFPVRPPVHTVAGGQGSSAQHHSVAVLAHALPKI